MRNRLVTYNGTVQRWEAAHNDWEKTVYPEKIDLEQACSKDPWALKVFKHTTTYNNTPASRVKLARNIIIHLNDHRIGKKQSIYTSYELGALVDELFPNLSSRLFEFLWKQRINLDFKRSRNTFKSI
ncbi:uncharacterized protein LOC112183527 [Rosa chinensis]|uniref:uncharacterized protein LOC112183527 n=1 Tax=Rosa chinensis TaxID=74649 RepID=UPI001AD92C2F|nr:uncharacterized protein LOC112183527 [Rosa chinensis]